MKILVADDDVMIADCSAEALADEGHVVCGIAATVAEALALARLHQPDVAVLDMQLRGEERGTDIAHLFAEMADLRQMGILYVTGESSRVHREARAGHACLSKPYTATILIIALEIVYEIARSGSTSRALPRGMQLLRIAEVSPQAAT